MAGGRRAWLGSWGGARPASSTGLRGRRDGRWEAAATASFKVSRTAAAAATAADAVRRGCASAAALAVTGSLRRFAPAPAAATRTSYRLFEWPSSASASTAALAPPELRWPAAIVAASAAAAAHPPAAAAAAARSGSSEGRRIVGLVSFVSLVNLTFPWQHGNASRAQRRRRQ